MRPAPKRMQGRLRSESLLAYVLDESPSFDAALLASRSAGSGRTACHLRGDFEGDAGVVGSARAGGAEDVASAVHDYAIGEEVAVGAVQLVHHAVFPGAVLLRRQFEDHAAGEAAAVAEAAAGSGI